MRTKLGLGDRTFWGMAPADLGARCAALELPNDNEHDHHHHHGPDTKSFCNKYKLSEEAREELNTMIELAAAPGHHGEEPNIRFFVRPSVVQNWGDKEPELHADNQSLFLDLVYVGIAYQLGTLVKYSFYACTPSGDGSGSAGSSSDASMSAASMSDGSMSSDGSSSESSERRMVRMLGSGSGAGPECVGLGDGLLHVVVFFVTLFFHWILDAWWDAKYESAGFISTRLMEFINLFAIISAASCITDVQELRSNPRNWWYFCLMNVVAILIWMIRYLQIALFARAVNARREASSLLLTCGGCLALMTGAWACASYPDLENTYDIMIALLVCTFFYWPLRFMFREQVQPASLLERYKEVSTPLNVELLVHRVNEFMMLMLGETVLQLVIAAWPEVDKDQEPNRWAEFWVNTNRDTNSAYQATMGGGLLMALCMMHSHSNTYPEKPENHAGRRGATTFYFFLIFVMFKAMFVMMVGIGVKLTLYAPSEPENFHSFEQRIEMSIGCVGVFGIQLLIKPLHEGVREYFGPVLSLRSPLLTASLTLRLIITIAMFAVCAVEMIPWKYLWLMGGLALVATLMLQLEMYARYHDSALRHDHGHGDHGHGGHGHGGHHKDHGHNGHGNTESSPTDVHLEVHAQVVSATSSSSTSAASH